MLGARRRVQESHLCSWRQGCDHEGVAGVIEIHDPEDPRLVDYRDLTDAEIRRAAEFFVAESVPVISRLLRSGHPVRSVLVTPERYGRLREHLRDLDAPVFVAGREVLNRVAGFNLHRGAVAAANRLPEPRLDEALRTAALVAVLEGLNDHENLGLIFRGADALGVDLVLLDPTCADPYYRRAVRVSMGSVLAVPFVRLAEWPAGLHELRVRGFHLIALTPDRAARPIDELENRATRVALLLGSEAGGLRAKTMELADHRVRIPIRARVDSLNVGHAAAIAFHRFGRMSLSRPSEAG